VAVEGGGCDRLGIRSDGDGAQRRGWEVEERAGSRADESSAHVHAGGCGAEGGAADPGAGPGA
jgi:hypothetical protein